MVRDETNDCCSEAATRLIVVRAKRVNSRNIDACLAVVEHHPFG